METKVLTINRDCPEENLLRDAAAVLRDGGLVAFPTETVYGLGANGLSGDACKKIFAAKGRPSDNPLILHIANLHQVEALTRDVPAVFYQLAEAFWPGPLTMILPKSDRVPDAVSAGLATVAIRMPSHPIAKKLIELADLPVAAPSANRSGSPSPTRFEHLFADMNGRAEMLIDGGDCAVGVESTVLDLTREPYTILRPGAVTEEMLKEFIPTVRVYSEKFKGGTPPSPGMKYRHYAPKAQVQVARNRDVLSGLALKYMAEKKNVAVLFEPVTDFWDNLKAFYPEAKSVEDRAEKLFAALREGDEWGADIILTTAVPVTGMGRAYMNRLMKAAGSDIVEAPPKKILFICTGNTCRSAMAEGILKHLGGEKYEVLSAGLAAYDGEPANPKAIEVMAELGIDISNHRAQMLTPELLGWVDTIVTMTAEQARQLKRTMPFLTVKTLGSLSGDRVDVADPYGGTLDTYRACRDMLVDMIQKFIDTTEEERK